MKTNNKPVVRVYLRASTKEQNAKRAEDAIDNFLASYNIKATSRYYENESGAKLRRPELIKLLNIAAEGDVIIVEQIDRLSRLDTSDWEQLKAMIRSKNIKLVSMDLPTSFEALTLVEDNSLTNSILKAVNNLLLDILAITARKDYEDRRRRQAQGIEFAKAAGKFKGKQQSPKTVEACKKALALVDKGYSKKDACSLAGIGLATLYRYIKSQKA